MRCNKAQVEEIRNSWPIMKPGWRPEQYRNQINPVDIVAMGITTLLVIACDKIKDKSHGVGVRALTHPRKRWM